MLGGCVVGIHGESEVKRMEKKNGLERGGGERAARVVYVDGGYTSGWVGLGCLLTCALIFLSTQALVVPVRVFFVFVVFPLFFQLMLDKGE